MANRQNGKRVYSNQRKTPDIDCCVCIHRKECERAEEGSFCGQFQSREVDPKARGTDPNWLWEHGEEVEFDS